MIGAVQTDCLFKVGFADTASLAFQSGEFPRVCCFCALNSVNPEQGDYLLEGTDKAFKCLEMPFVVKVLQKPSGGRP